MSKVKQLLSIGKSFLSTNAPTIFQIAGTAGFIGTVGTAIRIAPSAKYEMEGRERSENKIDDAWLAVKTGAPLYGPVIGLGVISLGCFYASNHIVTKQNAMLAAAASISERALVEYQEQVVKKLGEAAHGDILEAVAANTDEEVFNVSNFIEGDGDTLCYDKVTGRYFTSSPDKIRQAENTVMKRCVDDFTVKLNDFYYELGLDDVSLIGEAVGWDISKVKPDIRFSAMLENNKTPCLVLNYHVCMLNRNVLESVW